MSAAPSSPEGFQDADLFYEQLLDAHTGLSPAQSALVNARLILLLAQRVGDTRVLQECIAAAKDLPTQTDR